MPDGPGRFTQDYTCPALLRITLGPLWLRVQDCHLLRCSFPAASARRQSSTPCSYYPADALLHPRFGLFPGRSPLLGESLLFSLPAGTKMFQFPAFASPIFMVIAALQAAGLSHSEIRESMVICTYSRLIAAYHVLHRLCEPRHPPSALSCFFLPTPHDARERPELRNTGWTEHTQRHGAHTFGCIVLRLRFFFTFLQSCLYQHVNELSRTARQRRTRIDCVYPFLKMWRITDSNR